MTEATTVKPPRRLPPIGIGHRLRAWRAWVELHWSLTRARRGQPVIFGPWHSEVGFEALYWTAFVAWCRQQYPTTTPTLLLTRGGAAHWVPNSTALEIYAMRDITAVRRLTLRTYQDTRQLKQIGVTAWDRNLLREAAAVAGYRRPVVVHPSLMYGWFAGWWEEWAPLRRVAGCTRYERLQTPDLPEGLTLPREYVAMRWYHRATFPAQPDLIPWARAQVRRVAAQVPVVLLTSSLHTDDHVDFPIVARDHPLDSLGQVTLVALDDPLLHLAHLAAVLGRARAFVGTYGGVAQLSMRLGIPSLSAYAAWGGTARAHLSLSHYVALASGIPFHVAHVQEPAWWTHALTVPRGSSGSATMKGVS